MCSFTNDIVVRCNAQGKHSTPVDSGLISKTVAEKLLSIVMSKARAIEHFWPTGNFAEKVTSGDWMLNIKRVHVRGNSHHLIGTVRIYPYRHDESAVRIIVQTGDASTRREGLLHPPANMSPAEKKRLITTLLCIENPKDEYLFPNVTEKIVDAYDKTSTQILASTNPPEDPKSIAVIHFAKILKRNDVVDKIVELLFPNEISTIEEALERKFTCEELRSAFNSHWDANSPQKLRGQFRSMIFGAYLTECMGLLGLLSCNEPDISESSRFVLGENGWICVRELLEKRANDRITDINRQIERNEAQVERLANRIEQLRAELEKIGKESQDLNAKIKKLNEERTRLQYSFTSQD